MGGELQSEPFFEPFTFPYHASFFIWRSVGFVFPGKTISRWWFQILFIFTPKIGEDEPMLTHIFQLG